MTQNHASSTSSSSSVAGVVRAAADADIVTIVILVATDAIVQTHGVLGMVVTKTVSKPSRSPGHPRLSSIIRTRRLFPIKHLIIKAIAVDNLMYLIQTSTTSKQP